ncbi:MAG: 5-deoxy-glucuronate isomerase [Nocardioides sp.]|nr:5-deoxy-glucuronate isomerase [Nocardioides sp.]
MTDSEHVVRAGQAADATYDVVVTPASAGWGRSGLRVVTLAAGGHVNLETGDAETVIVPLAGSATVVVDGERFELTGRGSVFEGPTDVLYAPRDAEVALSTAAGGRFALCSAVCERRLDPAYVPRSDVPVELRGAGQASRQVHNFGVPGVLEAERLIACEVLTPGGNWSSYPPHKHDEQREGETRLEEIYYFEVADGPAGPGLGYQRVYGHAGADIDVCAEVRSGDVVLVPHGWHGPSMAAPGYDLYYLNVMAGPGPERAWLIIHDPDHAWVRDTWLTQQVDPRLPFSRPTDPDGTQQREGASR